MIWGPFLYEDPPHACPVCGRAWGRVDPAAESVRCGCGKVWRVHIAREPEGVLPGMRFYLEWLSASEVPFQVRYSPRTGQWIAFQGFLQYQGSTAGEAAGLVWASYPTARVLFFPKSAGLAPREARPTQGPTGAHMDPGEWIRYVIEGGPKPGPTRAT